MNIEILASQIRTLETQLAVLKAQVEKLSAPGTRRTFGDLHGMFAGPDRLSLAAFEAAKYQFEWDGKLEG
jgi:hypothetical protein